MYQNECRRATARSNGFCTAAAQEVGKLTWPMRSPAVCADGVEGEAASTDTAREMASAARWFIGSSRRGSLPDFRAADAAAARVRRYPAVGRRAREGDRRLRANHPPPTL